MLMRISNLGGRMPAYLISYDLRKDRNYDALIGALRKSGAISPLRSVWLGNFSGSAGEVERLLRIHMDSDDGLMVVELKPGSNWAFSLVNEDAGPWLQRCVTP